MDIYHSLVKETWVTASSAHITKGSIRSYYLLLTFIMKDYFILSLQDFEKISNFISSHFSTDLEEVELSVKGWNWGSTRFTGQSTVLLLDKKWKT